MRIRLRYFFAAVFTLINTLLFSQSTFLPSGHEWHHFLERMEIKSGKNSSTFHSLMKPVQRKAMVDFLESLDHKRLTPTDKYIISDILQSNIEWASVEPDSSRRRGVPPFYKTPVDLIRYHDKDLFLSINPVMHLQYGLESDREEWLYQNTRGLEIRGMINKKVGFYSYMADNQSKFPMYVSRKMASQRGVVPGEGWNIPFKDGGTDYFTARGYIAMQATKNIGLQFGQDRNSVGFGHRSLLLSDYSNNYLFLKINTHIWKLNYQNVFAKMVDYPWISHGGRMYDTKYMAMHTLSINISDRFQLGIFENVVFGRTDTVSRRGFDAHYLNPVIFYRAIEHHIGDPDKVAIGLNWRWIAGHRLAFFGQFYMDDFYVTDIKNDLDSLWVSWGLRDERKYRDFGSFRNKFGTQVGMQWVDFLGIRNLDMHLEGYWVRPFTYSHFDPTGSRLPPASSYSHYGQALAHPLGANFRENITSLQYRPHPDWQLKVRHFAARQGMDSLGINMGGNIMRDYTTRLDDYGNTFLQGEIREWTMVQADVSWQLRPNIWIDFTFINRLERFENPAIETLESAIFQLGLRVNALRREHWF
jgi:hypothetical protein